MIDPESANKSMQLLKISDFYDSKHQSIYEGIIELFNKNKNIDYISLIDQLKKSNNLEGSGGAHYITGLTNSAPSAMNIEYYANIVKEKSVLRNIIKVGQSLRDEAYADTDPVDTILDKAEQNLFTLTQDSQKNNLRI